jgi:hypothetical protein
MLIVVQPKVGHKGEPSIFQRAVDLPLAPQTHRSANRFEGRAGTKVCGAIALHRTTDRLVEGRLVCRRQFAVDEADIKFGVVGDDEVAGL